MALMARAGSPVPHALVQGAFSHSKQRFASSYILIMDMLFRFHKNVVVTIAIFGKIPE
jgi:hypothetical protein